MDRPGTESLSLPSKAHRMTFSDILSRFRISHQNVGLQSFCNIFFSTLNIKILKNPHFIFANVGKNARGYGPLKTKLAELVALRADFGTFFVPKTLKNRFW